MSNRSKKLHELSEFPHISHEHMQALMRCFSVCCSCSKKCIEEGHVDTAVLCSDCADLCALAIKFHSSESEFDTKIANICAEACTRCAEACAEHSAEHCKQCCQVCHECAEQCAVIK